MKKKISVAAVPMKRSSTFARSLSVCLKKAASAISAFAWQQLYVHAIAVTGLWILETVSEDNICGDPERAIIDEYEVLLVHVDEHLAVRKPLLDFKITLRVHTAYLVLLACWKNILYGCDTSDEYQIWIICSILYAEDDLLRN